MSTAPASRMILATFEPPPMSCCHRLCRLEPKGLVYVLTVLARNGKVTQARVDAADGHWLGGG